MKVDTDELVDTLSNMKDALVYDLIKGGTYSEWNRGILAGKIDMLDEIITMIEKDS